MSRLTAKIVLFTGIIGMIACGGDYFDAYLSSNETIEVNAVRRLSITSNVLRNSSCQQTPNNRVIDCIPSSWIHVGLTPQLTYAGDPEVVYDLQDLIFGEDNLEEPEVIKCGSLGTIFMFFIPRENLDFDDDGTIAGDIADDVFDSLTQEFRVNVQGVSAGDSVPIYVRESSRAAALSCAAVFSSTPERRVKVNI